MERCLALGFASCLLLGAGFGCSSAAPGSEPDEPGDVPGASVDGGTPSDPEPAAVFVLAAGFGASGEQGFADSIPEAIRALGHLAYRTEVPPFGSVAARAGALAPQLDAILAETGAPAVHVIAHSMGGLDARYLISRLGYADRVESLTTISTPHQGTPLADAALGLSGAIDGDSALGLFDVLAGAAAPGDPGFDEALVDLSEANAATFNAETPDAPGVLYQSYAGLSTAGGLPNPNAAAACATEPATDVPDPDLLRPILLQSAPILAGLERRPHDGVVPVASARWGSFRGCVSADHIDLVGVLDTGNSTLDVAVFYAAIAAELAP